MLKNILCLGCIAISLSSFSQDLTLEEYLSLVYRHKSTHHLQYEDIEGTPYSNEKFQNGSIVLLDSTVIENVPLRYDWHQKEVELSSDGKVFTLPKDNHIKFVTIGSDKYVPLFYSKYVSGYAIRLYANNTTLFKVENVKFLEAAKPKSGYEEFKPAHFDWSKPDYILLFRNNTFQKLNRNKKKIILSFPKGNQEQLATFIKREKLSFKNDSDIIKLIKYFDSIPIPSTE